MNMPFRRSKPLSVRVLNAVASGAGSARGMIRRHGPRLKRRG